MDMRLDGDFDSWLTDWRSLWWYDGGFRETPQVSATTQRRCLVMPCPVSHGGRKEEVLWAIRMLLPKLQRNLLKYLWGVEKDVWNHWLRLNRRYDGRRTRKVDANYPVWSRHPRKPECMITHWEYGPVAEECSFLSSSKYTCCITSNEVILSAGEDHYCGCISAKKDSFNSEQLVRGVDPWKITHSKIGIRVC